VRDKKCHAKARIKAAAAAYEQRGNSPPLTSPSASLCYLLLVTCWWYSGVMKKSPVRAVSARVGGRVQGVAFRYYAKNEADGLGLTGWVRNNDDGSVEVWAEGPEDKLNMFLEWLSRGPSHAHIDSFQKDWQPPAGKFKTFSVVI
jgi:acylphosphatase